jgi:hypothetical protein
MQTAQQVEQQQQQAGRTVLRAPMGGPLAHQQRGRTVGQRGRMDQRMAAPLAHRMVEQRERHMAGLQVGDLLTVHVL